MGKIKSYYNNGIDKVWYDSSNILYSECDDNVNQLKTLRIVFKNGRTYEYYGVDVNDYLLFRENASQGKALNQYIKKYKYEKISDANLLKIEEELQDLMNTDKNYDKSKLFESLEGNYKQIIKIVNEFKQFDLNKNEYSYLLYIINKIMQALTITNFSDKDLNLLEIKDNLDNNISLLQSESNISNEIELFEKIKNKLLK